MESQAQAESRENISKLKNIWDFVKNVRWFLSAYIALAAFVLVKNFGYDIIRVNNKDMLATYNFGDAVIVKKSFNKYNTNDVIYFQYPVQDSAGGKTFMIQRIFGLPGDSVEIINKEVYINGMRIQDTSSIKQNYQFKSVQTLDSAFKSSFNLVEGGEISNDFDYSYSLTKNEYEVLKAHPYIVSIEMKCEKPNAFDEVCFPYSSSYPWNSDFFGKLYIPKINDTLTLDTNTIKLYRSIIYDHEKNNLRVNGDSIFINGENCKRYVVKKNYYFVLGDNRGNANDSRNWGYLPENFIIGKVVRTIRSKR